MFTNRVGIKVYENGDLVSVGKGKTVYQVFNDFVTESNTIGIQSLASGKISNMDVSRINFVKSAQDVAYEGGCTVEELLLAPSRAVHDENEPAKEHTAYQKAVLFALNTLGKHVYAGTVTKTKKARTRKLNLRQKASRKANR